MDRRPRTDRLSNDPNSPYHDAALLERGISMGFKAVRENQCRGVLRQRGLDPGIRRHRQGSPRQSADDQAQQAQWSPISRQERVGQSAVGATAGVLVTGNQPAR